MENATEGIRHVAMDLAYIRKACMACSLQWDRYALMEQTMCRIGLTSTRKNSTPTEKDYVDCVTSSSARQKYLPRRDLNPGRLGESQIS